VDRTPPLFPAYWAITVRAGRYRRQKDGLHFHPRKRRKAAVNDLQSRIDQLEARSVESRLIADLATDPEARLYNTSLARELMDQATKLRCQLPATQPA
jgi:hypothetical protein